MAGSSPPGSSRPPVRVRYYPRRVARPPVVEPLSPGQALHLVNDPERAELARHTSEQQVFVAVEQPPAAAPVVQPAPEPVAVLSEGGWLSRVWRRLIRSH